MFENNSQPFHPKCTYFNMKILNRAIKFLVLDDSLLEADSKKYMVHSLFPKISDILAISGLKMVTAGII